MINKLTAAERLIRHEGIKLQPYKDDKGLWTIGVGRCIDKNPFSAAELKAVGDWEHGITQNAALMLLRNDMDKIMAALQKKLPFWKTLDGERQYALLDMAFQMGVGGLLKFKKMLAAMAVKNWKLAAAECLNSSYGKTYKTRAGRIAATVKTGKFVI